MRDVRLFYDSKTTSFYIEKLTRRNHIRHEIEFIKKIASVTRGSWRIKMVGNRFLFWFSKPFYSRKKIWITMDKLFKAGDNGEYFYEYVKKIVERVHKYLTAFNEIVNDYEKSGLLPVYKAGYNNINKKYLTIGIQGFIESAEFIKKFILPDSDMAIRPDSKTYAEYANKLCKTIADLNKAARTEKCRFNTEFVPGESLGVKNAKWDKEDGLYVPRDVYNSYFYIVEDEGTSVIDNMSPSSFFAIFLSLFCSALSFLNASATSDAPID